MNQTIAEPLSYWHKARYLSEQSKGHYESYFLRANHPEEKRAFWIRYTIFHPKNETDKTIGELWVIYFDGEKQIITAAKDEVPINQCQFSRQSLSVDINGSYLTPGELKGSASQSGNRIEWSLKYDSSQAPLIFLPEKLYEGSFPKAKSVITNPRAFFKGNLTVNGEVIDIDNWVGSENHNWGSQHTNQYAWGQVVSFDNAPDIFMECATARVKLGPIYSPWLTIITLRDGKRDILLNGLWQAVKNRGKYSFFDWQFSGTQGDVSINGHITGAPNEFVGLTYYNPPGGSNTCLNSKVARCELTLREKGKPERILVSNSGCAFEILTSRTDHGVPIVV